MRLIDADKLKAHYAWWDNDDKELFDAIIDQQPTVELKESETEFVNISIYDIEEIHENCTVQVLKNSVTGDVSVGWWENESEVE